MSFRFNPLLPLLFETEGLTFSAATNITGTLSMFNGNTTQLMRANALTYNPVNIRLGINTPSPISTIHMTKEQNVSIRFTKVTTVPGQSNNDITFGLTDIPTLNSAFVITQMSDSKRLALFSNSLCNLTERLDIISTLNAGAMLRLTNTLPGGKDYGIVSTSNTNFSGPGRLLFNDGSTVRLAIGPDGNFGIGLATPTSKLHVDAGDVRVDVTRFYYMGSPDTNGSVRIGKVGDDFVVQVRQAGVWVSKLTQSLL